MGGPGSGRFSGRGTTDGSQPLDIRRIYRAGLLAPGRLFSWQWSIGGKPYSNIRARVEGDRVVLIYRSRRRGDTDWQDVEQPVRVDHTPCNYGGTRPWWRCPSCNRRVAVIYSPGERYACRHCYRLGYETQRSNFYDRGLLKAQRIRIKLGGTANMTIPFPWKPKGMHWRTYERMRARAGVGEQRSLLGLQKWLQSMKRPQ